MHHKSHINKLFNKNSFKNTKTATAQLISINENMFQSFSAVFVHLIYQSNLLHYSRDFHWFGLKIFYIKTIKIKLKKKTERNNE